MRYLVFKLLIIIFLFFLVACKNEKSKTNCKLPPQKSTQNKNITPNKITPQQYQQLILQLHYKKSKLTNAYIKANGMGTMQSIIYQAKDSLMQIIIKDLFTCWYGTAWDFNGITQIPQQGKIACGYFVTTILRDAGFNMPRVKWAQAPSQTIIQKMCSPVKFFNNQPIENLYNYINQQPNNIYIVGLDNHVGFIYKQGNDIKFVHSNYYQKEIGVMAQNLNNNNPLKKSSYRILGTLLNNETVKAWLISETMQ